MLKKPCLGLLRQANKLRHNDPKGAVRVAEGARDLAARIDAESLEYPEWLLLQSEAWATLGSAYRATADLRKAESAIAIAWAFLDVGDQGRGLDPLFHPRLAQRASYLRCDQGRFEEALDLNREALSIYSDLMELQHLARAWVDRALILGRFGKPRHAIDCLIRAFFLLDPVDSARSFLAATHNMTLYLCESAQTEEENREARRWLALASRQHTRLPETVNLLKLCMLEGMMAVRHGSEAEGIRKLWQAHDGFERLESPQNQAVVLLQLASVYLARGATEEVKRLAGRLFPIFRKLEVDHEVGAALMLFYKAAQTQKATQELLEHAMHRVGECHSLVQIPAG
ncbi:MAG: hypothetical protein AAF657_02160 [Acidobacteriota bacterium]